MYQLVKRTFPFCSGVFDDVFFERVKFFVLKVYRFCLHVRYLGCDLLSVFKVTVFAAPSLVCFKEGKSVTLLSCRGYISE